MVFKDVDPVKQVTVLDVQWSNIPEDVYDEVRNLWEDRELGNDYFYVTFNVEEEEAQYPLIAGYLRSRGLEEVLLHWWW